MAAETGKQYFSVWKRKRAQAYAGVYGKRLSGHMPGQSEGQMSLPGFIIVFFFHGVLLFLVFCLFLFVSERQAGSEVADVFM